MMSTSIFGQQISAAFDKLSAVSCISWALATSFNCDGNYIAHPVNGDMGQGSFTCVVDFRIVDELSAGVILGKDWLAYYHEYMIFDGQLRENCHNDGGGWSHVISGASSNFHLENLLIFIVDVMRGLLF